MYYYKGVNLGILKPKSLLVDMRERERALKSFEILGSAS